MEGPTVGQRFREKREAKRLTLEEVTASTKIPSVFLKAIEEDDYRLLPDEMYLLGFLSSYAIFLGLNPQEIAALFREQVKRKEERSFIPAPPKVYTFSVRKALLPLSILLVLIPLIFIGLSLFQQPQEIPSVKSRPAERPVSEVPIDFPAAGGLTASQPSVPFLLRDLDIPTEAPPQHTLTAKAKELTWVAVNIDGEEEHEILLRPGEVTRWTAKERFVLTIGNAGGIELTLDGTPLPQLGASGQVIRRLILPREEGMVGS